ncbi:hypothetical protein F5B20DRAFT_577777 [Whalleya microplaca]|nr:hypothetical protein F5B20DRAFT_577777 [Whalleya microplaca]
MGRPVRDWYDEPMIFIHPTGHVSQRVFHNYDVVEIQADYPEYQPNQRIRYGRPFDDGIPDEVMGPDSSAWMDLGHWLTTIARSWKRIGWRFDHDTCTQELSEVSFEDVIRYRLDEQAEYSEITHNLVNLQRNAFESDNFQYRASSLICSLGLEPYWETFAEVEALLASPAVTVPWSQYCQNYLELHSRTRNAVWGKIQYRLAQSIRGRDDKGCQRLGYGHWETPIDRSSWSHEDFACRFILHLYDLMSNPELPIEHMGTIPYVTTNWCLSRNHEDRHFFGFSLLCLLTLSWQYKRRVKVKDVLIPAMTPFFSPQKFKYPKVQVGKLDLSPFSPWIYWGFGVNDLDNNNSDN